MGMVRYPLPITPAMLTPANPSFDRPRHTGVGVGSDWSGGATGNARDTATAASTITDATGNVGAPYSPKNQAQKAALMVPPMPIVSDLGMDYGPHAGLAGRTGPIQPFQPYPDATSPPIVSSVTPNTGPQAGSTVITITGAGFNGATAVSIGGTACTGVTVVNNNTITANTPAKAAGPYGVLVTTPRGTSQAGVTFTTY